MCVEIGGIFKIEILENKNIVFKTESHNMVVNGGINQIAKWLSSNNNSSCRNNHKSGEVLFSNLGVKRINISNFTVNSETDSYENINASIDSWNNTFSVSNNNNGERKISIEFIDSITKEKNTVSLKAIGLYGKRTSNYNYNTKGTTITLERTLPDGTVSEKKYYYGTVLSPLIQSNEALTESTGNNWFGGKYYSYLTFDKIITNDEEWIVKQESTSEDSSSNSLSYNYSENATPDKGFLEYISKITITDNWNSKVQLNEIDIFVQENKLPESPSIIKLGTGNLETNSTDENLNNFVSNVNIDSIEIENNIVRYNSYLLEDELNDIEFKEIGLFFKDENNNEKMFARSVFPVSWTKSQGQVVKIYYELQVN